MQTAGAAWRGGAPGRQRQQGLRDGLPGPERPNVCSQAGEQGRSHMPGSLTLWRRQTLPETGLKALPCGALSPFQGYGGKTSLSVRIHNNHRENICQDSSIQYTSFLRQVGVHLETDFKNGKSSWSRIFLITRPILWTSKNSEEREDSKKEDRLEKRKACIEKNLKTQL